MRIGSRLIGVRANQQLLVEELRRVLAPSIVSVAAGTVVQPNITVQSEGGDARLRSVPYVYRRSGLALRAGSIGHAVRVVVGLLASFGEPPAGVRPLRARALIGRRGATLVSELFGPALDTQVRTLARKGLRLAPGAPVLVDAATLELVMTPPDYPLDEDALADVCRRFPVSAEEVGLQEPRVPVVAVVGFSTAGSDLSAAEQLMQLFPLVVGNEAAPTGSDLAMLAGLAEGAEVTMLSDYDIEPVIALALAAAVS